VPCCIGLPSCLPCLLARGDALISGVSDVITFYSPEAVIMTSQDLRRVPTNPRPPAAPLSASRVTGKCSRMKRTSISLVVLTKPGTGPGSKPTAVSAASPNSARNGNRGKNGSSQPAHAITQIIVLVTALGDQQLATCASRIT
jgi:hypothetical protein